VDDVAASPALREEHGLSADTTTIPSRPNGRRVRFAVVRSHCWKTEQHC